MNTFLVPTMAIDEIWPKIGQMFVDCLNENDGDCSAGELRQMCRAGGAFLIASNDGQEIKSASICRFETWLSGAVLRCLIMAGDEIDLWLEDYMKVVTALAKEGGAETFVWDGRAGWKRKFPEAEIVKYRYKMKV